MLRQSLALGKDFMLRKSVFMSRQCLAVGGNFMLQQSVFMSRWSLIKTKSFYVKTELAKVKRIYVATEYFCFAIEFGLGRGFYVAIESSRTWGFPCRDIALYVATVGQGQCVATRLRACNREALSRQCGAVLHHNREGHARATDQVGRTCAID